MLPAAKNCVLRQLNISAVKKYRQGFSPYLHNPEHLGKQPERRYCLPSGFYGNSSQKARKRRRFCAVYPNAYRSRMQNVKSGINLQTKKAGRFLCRLFCYRVSFNAPPCSEFPGAQSDIPVLRRDIFPCQPCS